jgi:hypothetical protein
MFKFFLRFLALLLISVISIIVYLSYFGVETDRFDRLIKSKANEVNQYIKLDFNKTKIYLNLEELNLIVKLQNPKILIKDNKINLSKIDLYLALKSFITSDFLLQRVEIAFFKNDIKDLTKITNIFVPRIINKQIKKIFFKGEIEGEFIIPFNSDGSIAENYTISAKVLHADIHINSDLKINNLSTDIKYFFNSSNDKTINFYVHHGKILNLDLNKSSIDINLKDGKKIIKTKIKTSGILNYSEIKIISSLLGYDLKNIKNIEFSSDLESSVKLLLDKRFKITDREFSINGKIHNLNFKHKEVKNIKEFLPSYNSKIILKNSEINFDPKNLLKISGLIKFDKDFKDFSLSRNMNKNFNLAGNINLHDLSLKIPYLNYFKEKNIKANIDFRINSSKSNYMISGLTYSSEKSKIESELIKLNKKFEIEDVKNIRIITFKKNIKNNDFYINKHTTLKNTISVKGKLFDVEPLLKSLYKTEDKKVFSKHFKRELKVNFDKTITGTNDDVSNFSLIASIKKGSFNKLSLKGNFSKNEIIEVSIYQLDENKRTLQVISDRARPFIKNFNFIKGFEGGKLEYESTIFKEKTISNLLITDFKISKVSALAKLLTLASLQGIADTLSGEGIRFQSFEMKSYSKDNIMNIEDALAMGPAVSILLDGYVDKGKVVSLRGTLVPATKLNAIIASIPLVGKILVGQKTGEGVVGVSFKMKGPPKDIKTTVNPIKTLTPRFIVRAVEKMKKKKKEETK